MATAAADRFALNIHHLEIMRGVLERVLATGDVLGHDCSGRFDLAVAVEPWLFDAVAEFGTDHEDRVPDPEEDDGL
jgi:hypothetical protein